MQPAVVVGLISMMTGGALQEDIVATARVLVRKGRDILDSNPMSETTRFEASPAPVVRRRWPAAGPLLY
jgi:hypothetical protein